MGSIGSTVRRALGRYERPISNLYRRVFIDLEDMAGHIRNWSSPKAILEIGCGEGALAELLTRDFPDASYLGIDIIAHCGRMYEGRRSNVAFRQIAAEELAMTHPKAFDLVIINDVLHHVAEEQRLGIFRSAAALLADGGNLVFKDWLHRPTPIHALCYFADAYIGGDRSVRYMPRAEQEALIAQAFGPNSICGEATVRPWRQNLAFLIRARVPEPTGG